MGDFGFNQTGSDMFLVTCNKDRTNYWIYQFTFESMNTIKITSKKCIQNKLFPRDSNVRIAIVENHIFFLKNHQQLLKMNCDDFETMYEASIDEENRN